MKTQTHQHADTTPEIRHSSFVIRHCLLLLSLLLASFTTAQAQTVPLFINYQGKVTDSAGVGLGTPTPLNRKVIFRIYDAATSGTLLWTEEQTVTLSGGEFSVLLGQGIVFAAESRPALDTVFTSSGTGRFLQITVDNGDGTINGSDAAITPRQQITSTAYSFRARSADTVASGTDLQLNNSANYGLGWYGTGRTFGGTAIDGPVLYGLAGGALGSYNGTTQTTALRWNASGQVGVGSATLSGMDATSKLLLQGDDSTAPPKQLTIRGTTDTNKRLYLGYNTTSNYGALQAYNGVSTATNLVLNEIGGNVGIGTTSISAKLDVAGAIKATGAGGFTFNTGDQDGGLFSPADGVLTFLTNGTERLRLDASGNVGIGATPGDRLHVTGGNIRLQSGGSPVAYNLTDSGGTARGVLGLPTAGGNYSADAVANDFVIRADTGKLLLQSGTGASAICIASGNNVGVGTGTPDVSFALTLRGKNIGGGDSGLLMLRNSADTGKWHMTVRSSGGLDVSETGVADNRLFLAAGGNVGISTASPTQAKLVVSGFVNGSGPGSGNYSWITASATTYNQPSQAVSTSIYATHAIWTGSYLQSSSDQRIKVIDGVSDGVADLQTLLGLRVTDYRFKDRIYKGSVPQKKLIAQQVEKVFPQAIGKQTDVVPDIYAKAGFKDGWVELETDLKKGERVRLIDEQDQASTHEVLEVKPGKFHIDFESEGDKVFVYGREVKDFRTLDYDAISMLNVSATQALARKVAALEKAHAEKDTALEALTKRLAALEARDKARDAKLAAIEKALFSADQPAARTVSLKKAAGAE